MSPATKSQGREPLAFVVGDVATTALLIDLLAQVAPSLPDLLAETSRLAEALEADDVGRQCLVRALHQNTAIHAGHPSTQSSDAVVELAPDWSPGDESGPYPVDGRSNVVKFPHGGQS